MTKIYVVRGTGYPIDGMLVRLESEDGAGMCTVLPYNKKQEVASSSLLVNKRYLQEISTDIKNYNYTINISKTSDSIDNSEELVLTYNSIVNARIESIRDFIDSNLKNILGK